MTPAEVGKQFGPFSETLAQAWTDQKGLPLDQPVTIARAIRRLADNPQDAPTYVDLAEAMQYSCFGGIAGAVMDLYNATDPHELKALARRLAAINAVMDAPETIPECARAFYAPIFG